MNDNTNDTMSSNITSTHEADTLLFWGCRKGDDVLVDTLLRIMPPEQVVRDLRLLPASAASHLPVRNAVQIACLRGHVRTLSVLLAFLKDDTARRGGQVVRASDPLMVALGSPCALDGTSAFHCACAGMSIGCLSLLIGTLFWLMNRKLIDERTMRTMLTQRCHYGMAPMHYVMLARSGLIKETLLSSPIGKARIIRAPTSDYRASLQLLRMLRNVGAANENARLPVSRKRKHGNGNGSERERMFKEVYPKRFASNSGLLEEVIFYTEVRR